MGRIVSSMMGVVVRVDADEKKVGRFTRLGEGILARGLSGGMRGCWIWGACELFH